jgi:hypothetical protein
MVSVSYLRDVIEDTDHNPIIECAKKLLEKMRQLKEELE